MSPSVDARAAVACRCTQVGQVIAGYTTATDVLEHSKIDLDQMGINDALGGGPDFTTASNIYNNGANSARGSGLRTIASMPGPRTTEAFFVKNVAYFGGAR